MHGCTGTWEAWPHGQYFDGLSELSSFLYLEKIQRGMAQARVLCGVDESGMQRKAEHAWSNFGPVSNKTLVRVLEWPDSARPSVRSDAFTQAHLMFHCALISVGNNKVVSLSHAAPELFSAI